MNINQRLSALECEVKIKQRELTVLFAKTIRTREMFKSAQGRQIKALIDLEKSKSKSRSK